LVKASPGATLFEKTALATAGDAIAPKSTVDARSTPESLAMS
jgi:hypothetical protein